MKYFVSIAGKTVVVDVAGDQVAVNGRTETAELLAVDGTPVRSLLVDGTSWMLPMEWTGSGRWLVQRFGEQFEVEVVDERTHHVRSLVGAGASAVVAASLTAPMPGLVVRVLIEAGQAVAPGQGLLVLEAMKMENELKSPGHLIVDQIRVQQGQAVEKGALLVTFRPPEPKS